MKDGHIQMIKEWTKQHGPVIRVALGEREAVSDYFQFTPVMRMVLNLVKDIH